MTGRRQRSALWEHFVKINSEEVVCGHCGEKLRKGGGTSNMKKHLERRHPTRLDQTTLTSSPTQDAFKLRPVALKASDAGSSTSDTQPSPGTHLQLTLPSCFLGRSLTSMAGTQFNSSLVLTYYNQMQWHLFNF